MKVLIYGGGAVGLGITASLIASDCRVTILARKDTAAQLRRKGLRRTGIFGHDHTEASRFNIRESLLGDVEPFDFVMVCTKSNASETVAAELKKRPGIFHAGTKIILCQNGWGNTEVFAACFPKTILYNARVITGFQRPTPNTVDITVHVAPVHIGSIYHRDTAAIDPLCNAIRGGGLPCESTGEIVKDLWAKMLYNCALNPLGAIFGVPYGALGESRQTTAIMTDIVHEVFQVMGAAGYATYWETPAAYLSLFFSELIPKTARHESSTLQDIRSGKSTEIDALNGAVVRLGDQLNVDVPVNRQICRMIRFVEERL